MEHVFNAVYTVLGGLIAGLVGWFLESRRRKYDAMLKHFDDIKNECLEPLRQKLTELRRFGYVGGYLPTYEVLDIVREEKVSVPSEDPRGWANYSFGNICNKVLYDDLVNHFPSLSKALAELEKEVRAGVPELLKALRALYIQIHSDEEIVQLRRHAKAKGLLFFPEDIDHIVFLVAIGVEESRWPLTYRKIIDDPEIADKLIRIGERLGGSREARRVREISESILTKAKHCLNEIEKIRLQKKLKGKCPYV